MGGVGGGDCDFGSGELRATKLCFLGENGPEPMGGVGGGDGVSASSGPAPIGGGGGGDIDLARGGLADVGASFCGDNPNGGDGSISFDGILGRVHVGGGGGGGSAFRVVTAVVFGCAPVGAAGGTGFLCELLLDAVRSLLRDVVCIEELRFLCELLLAAASKFLRDVLCVAPTRFLCELLLAAASKFLRDVLCIAPTRFL